MKIMLLLNCCFALMMSCGSLGQNNSAQKEYNKTLIGKWTGTSTSESVMKKTWQITRMKDGLFTKDEVWMIKGRMQKFKKTGTWWTKNGIYFEKNSNNETVAKFEYLLSKDNKIIFKAEKAENLAIQYIESKQ